MNDKPYFAVTWGETMVRLSSPAGLALEATPTLEVAIGGTESNMAIALARLGLRTAWVSRLPDNPLGRRVVHDVKAHGVDVAHVLWAPAAEKAGVYFIEPGRAPRANTVIYERKGSAVANVNPDELDYAFLSSGRFLHLTGITPALSPGCREAWLRSARQARAAGCRVVVDVNYRSRLWSADAARETLEAVFPHADVVLCALGDLQLLFGMPREPGLAAESFAAAYHLPLVVLTLGGEGALAWHDGQVERHPVFPTEVVDRIGSGDAFAAGFLYGWSERDIAYGLRCGNALAALKQTYHGDVTWSTGPDLLDLVQSQSVDPRKVSR